MGEARHPGPAHPGPGPPRVPEHPPDDHLPGQRTETRQTRSRTGTRLPQPPTAPRYDVGKTVKRNLSITAHKQRTG